MLDRAIPRGRAIFKAPPKIILYSKEYLIKLLELEGTINQPPATATVTDRHSSMSSHFATSHSARRFFPMNIMIPAHTYYTPSIGQVLL